MSGRRILLTLFVLLCAGYVLQYAICVVSGASYSPYYFGGTRGGGIGSASLGQQAYYNSTTTVTGRAVLSPCSFSGSTADVQINAAVAALSADGGVIHADCYGATAQTIAATVTLGSATQPSAASTPITMTTTLTLTSANNGQTFDHYRISTTNGPCVKMVNVSNVIISNSEIGPCGQNNSDNDSTGIEIIGGSGDKIYDSYIHVENRARTNSFSPTRSHSNIQGSGSGGSGGPTDITVQGNVICYGAANVRALDGATGWIVNGNFLCNPRGYDGSGNNFQAANSWNMLVENNFMYNCRLGSADSHQPTCPANRRYLLNENVEDNVNFYYDSESPAAAGTITGNYIVGGHSGSGSGTQADQGADGETVTNNTVLEVGNVGIAHASGANYTSVGNRIWSNNASPSANLVGEFDARMASGFPFGPCTVKNNVSNTHGGAADNNGYWPGDTSPCQGISGSVYSGNTFGAGADSILGLDAAMTAADVMAKIPPPLIPPIPKNCVVKSPYSTQTSLPSCQ